MRDQPLLDHLWTQVGQGATVLTRSAFVRLAASILAEAAEYERTKGKRAMSKTSPSSDQCPRCGAVWTFVPRRKLWLWRERSGATHDLKEYRDLDEEGQPPPLSRCPACGEKLKEP